MAWHKKHIPTQWGIAILGFLVVTTALLIPYLNMRQSMQSDAAYGGVRPTVAPTKRPLPTVVPTKKPLPTVAPTKKPFPTKVPRGYWW